jgi:hypothetical protein
MARRNGKTCSPLGVLPLGEQASLHGLSQAHGLVFFQGVQVVQTAQEQQVGDLLHHLQRVGDAAGPERIPDGVNLAAKFAGEHVFGPYLDTHKGVNFSGF